MLVRTSRARRRAVAWAGSVRSLVIMRQAFRFAKPCSTGARPAARMRLACFWPGVSLRARVALKPVTMTRSSGVLGFVHADEADEAQVGERAEAGRLQVPGDLVVAGGGRVVGSAQRSRSACPSRASAGLVHARQPLCPLATPIGLAAPRRVAPWLPPEAPRGSHGAPRIRELTAAEEDFPPAGPGWSEHPGGAREGPRDHRDCPRGPAGCT